MCQRIDTFPAPDVPTKAGTQATTEETSWSSFGTALVIDDEELIREVASMMLEDYGFSVLTACDGIDGIELFQQHKDIISLVLLDMTMPKMDGVSCFAALHEIKSDTPVLVSSGYCEEETALLFPDKSLAGFIQKPYSASDFEITIQRIIKHPPSTR